MKGNGLPYLYRHIIHQVKGNLPFTFFNIQDHISKEKQENVILLNVEKCHFLIFDPELLEI